VIEPDPAPAEATMVMVALLGGFGIPMTAVAAAFAFGSLEHIGKGVVVALVVWAVGGAVAWLHPLDTTPAGPGDASPVWRWGVPAAAIAAMIVVVYTGKPFVPWMLVLVVGTFFAWTTGSLWVISRRRSAGAPDA
jgi:hypothetical protein